MQQVLGMWYRSTAMHHSTVPTTERGTFEALIFCSMVACCPFI